MSRDFHSKNTLTDDGAPETVYVALPVVSVVRVTISIFLNTLKFLAVESYVASIGATHISPKK